MCRKRKNPPLRRPARARAVCSATIVRIRAPCGPSRPSPTPAPPPEDGHVQAPSASSARDLFHSPPPPPPPPTQGYYTAYKAQGEARHIRGPEIGECVPEPRRSARGLQILRLQLRRHPPPPPAGFGRDGVTASPPPSARAPPPGGAGGEPRPRAHSPPPTPPPSMRAAAGDSLVGAPLLGPPGTPPHERTGTSSCPRSYRGMIFFFFFFFFSRRPVGQAASPPTTRTTTSATFEMWTSTWGRCSMRSTTCTPARRLVGRASA